MIRRKPKRSGADSNHVAPANPTSVTGAPPPGSVPAQGDQPPPFVIDELMAAFSSDDARATSLARPALPGPPVDRDRHPGAQPSPRPEVSNGSRPRTEQLAGDRAGGTSSGPSTRAMSPTEFVAHVETALPPPPPELVPEPTRRSTRRSRKEARREAKREKRRLAEHDKAQKKARKQTRTARRKARRQGEVQGSALASADTESEVRIITPDDPSVPPVIAVAAPAPAEIPTPPADRPARGTLHIAGDDLPDAVHIEGRLDAAGTDRSTVFIDEDPNHAEVVSIDVATSAARMEPRIRERRIAVKRAVGRRRLKWIVIATGIVLIGVSVFAVLGSGLFTITDVRVDGRVYSGGAAFDAVVEELEGSNVLRLDTEQAERALEAIPWIEDARVTTDFPNGARIEVREREPSIAYHGTDGRYRVLDPNGRVLDVIAGQPVDYLELFIIGSAGIDLDPGERAPKGYEAAATLVQALPHEMRARVVSLSVTTDATDLRAVLDAPRGEVGSIEVHFGAAEDLIDKLVRLQTALTDPDPEDVPTEMIDVSGPDLITR